MTNELEQQMSEVLSDVQIPLENIAFALRQHLSQHGKELDPTTQILLAGLRDSVDRVAKSTHQITGRTTTRRQQFAAHTVIEHALAS
ncbi:MAG: hypothetical protein AB8B85_16745 [Paracoccaceae bacterium]